MKSIVRKLASLTISHALTARSELFLLLHQLVSNAVDPLTNAMHKMVRLQHLLQRFWERAMTWPIIVLKSRFFFRILLVSIALPLLATFFLPWEDDNQARGGWDTALGSAAQIIGGATAVVFALLVVPIQNAAAKYSPIFLRFIIRDPYLWALFGWTGVALAYTVSALGFGATAWRVGGALVLTLTVIGALGLAAIRVMSLLSPIELARIVASDTVRNLRRGISTDQARVDTMRTRLEQASGFSMPAGALGYPVPEAVVQEILSRIQPLLSIAAAAIESGQVDVVEALLTSVTNVLRAYLHERGGSATASDPLVTRVSEELLSLSQSARRATSQQMLPEVIRAFGRLAGSAVEVSTPGMGLGEQNVALMPMGYLKQVALVNLNNINNAAPALATGQLGSITHELLRRGLPWSTVGAITDELSTVMRHALQPYAYHVAGIGAEWLMRLWPLACTADGGQYVRDTIIKALEPFLSMYRSQPFSLERQQAIVPIVSPLMNRSGLEPLPAGAAVGTGLLIVRWPPDEELLEDIQRLGNMLIRELIWPATKDQRHDRLSVTWAMEQAVEIAVLLCAVACGTLKRPADAEEGVKTGGSTSVPDRTDSVELIARAENKAADAWSWVCRVLMGTCGRFAEVKSWDDISDSELELCREALTGTSACILAALTAMRQKESSALDTKLDTVMIAFCGLGETILGEWAEVLETDAVIQHLRLAGVWLLQTGRVDAAKRVARIVARAKSAPRDWDYSDRRYPTRLVTGSWRPPIISVTAQMAVPGFLRETQDLSTEAIIEPFEQLIRASGEGG